MLSMGLLELWICGGRPIEGIVQWKLTGVESDINGKVFFSHLTRTVYFWIKRELTFEIAEKFLLPLKKKYATAANNCWREANQLIVEVSLTLLFQ